MEKLSRRLPDKLRKYDEAEETVNDLNGKWSHTVAIFILGPTC
jgi:hypothetical protein